MVYVTLTFTDIADAVSGVCRSFLFFISFPSYYIFSILILKIRSFFRSQFHKNRISSCILTIFGYSINATIVIFDRIREELKLAPKNTDLAYLVNKSITQTLTRSIYTSLTTFITIAVLFVMGVSSIREFALPLMVGVVCGAYSSVCITGSLWYVMRTKIGGKAAGTAKQAGTKKK